MSDNYHPVFEPLANCPFCGTEAELIETEEDDNSWAPRPHRVYIASCEPCEVQMKRTSSRWYDGHMPAESDEDRFAKMNLIMAWNKREAEADLRRKIDEMTPSPPYADRE